MPDQETSTEKVTLTEDYCYNMLIKTFGFLDYEGTRILSRILPVYNLGDKPQDLYKWYSDKYGGTPAAAERSVRYLMDAINKEFTLEQLINMLNVKFYFTGDKFTVRFFIPALYMALVD